MVAAPTIASTNTVFSAELILNQVPASFTHARHEKSSTGVELFSFLLTML